MRSSDWNAGWFFFLHLLAAITEQVTKEEEEEGGDDHAFAASSEEGRGNKGNNDIMASSWSLTLVLDLCSGGAGTNLRH